MSIWVSEERRILGTSLFCRCWLCFSFHISVNLIMIVLIPTESTLSSCASQIVFFIFPKKRRAINHDVFLPDIFHVPGMLNFSNPAGKPAQNDDPLLVHKFISQPLFGGGQVILRPGAEKGRQFVRNDTMVSFVSFILASHNVRVVLDDCLPLLFAKQIWISK